MKQYMILANEQLMNQLRGVIGINFAEVEGMEIKDQPDYTVVVIPKKPVQKEVISSSSDTLEAESSSSV